MAEQIAAEAEPDIVIGEPDSGFSYYFKPVRGDTPYFEASQRGMILEYLSQHNAERVWLVTIGRDGTREMYPTELMDWLARVLFAGHIKTGARYVKSRPNVSPTERAIAPSPALPYKLLVQVYKSKGPSADESP